MPCWEFLQMPCQLSAPHCPAEQQAPFVEHAFRHLSYTSA